MTKPGITYPLRNKLEQFINYLLGIARKDTDISLEDYNKLVNAANKAKQGRS